MTTTWQPGDVVGVTEIVAALGAGGEADLYVGVHPRFGPDVVVKVFREPGLDLASLLQFAAVSHRAILPVLDHGVANDLPFVVQRRVLAADFAAWLALAAPDVPSLLEVIAEVGLALEAVHAAGSLHGDLGPGNVLVALDHDGWRPFLIDPLTGRSGALAGTPGFVAPERAAGGPPTVPGDVFSLGCLLATAVGRNPLSGDANLAPWLPLPKTPVAVLPPHLQSRADGAVDAATAADPAHRIASAGDVARMLRPLAAAVRAEPGRRVPHPPAPPNPYAPITQVAALMPSPPPSAPPPLPADAYYQVGPRQPEALPALPPPPPGTRWHFLAETLAAVESEEGGRRAATDGADTVECAVWAEIEFRPGTDHLVQVLVHLPEQADDAAAAATEADPSASRRGARTVEVPVARGEHLNIDLTIPGCEVDEPLQRLSWNGYATGVQFGVRLLHDAPPGPMLGTVGLSYHGVPVGRIRFRVTAMPPVPISPVTRVSGLANDAVRYRRAFISYANEDRGEVLRRIQVLRALGIEYVQDIDLEPGAEWQQRLFGEIDRCDLFLLMWSTPARDSTWVRSEVGHAIERRRTDPAGLPEIRPVVVEGPPVPAPWDELAHLHFNDRLLSLLAADPAMGA